MKDARSSAARCGRRGRWFLAVPPARILNAAVTAAPVSSCGAPRSWASARSRSPPAAPQEETGAGHAGTRASPTRSGSRSYATISKTHTLSSRYETFGPHAALRIAATLEFVHTPKHGSWLTIAEIDLAALGPQGLARRIADQATLATQVAV